ncbi:hypothetical protein HELRODRAFT_182167 [Helobdella robusta]|uniref:AB hydrolase-1 domain-containing protein n=1 Tax=Helobdella robusta TaxID=6412 RepID=T1FHU9_HELRO|nr:hypothetical protein HELRODRAFT_182167 [Helobdella robusta]ESN91195.1 hypothetical protein HELRODRAFT_182167 [Helobdella robusta]
MESSSYDENYSFYRSLFFSCAGAYILYYLGWVVKRPQLHCNDKFMKFVELHIPVLTEKFYPTIWCIEARCQTIIRSLFNRCTNIIYNRELLSLPDGGVVALDWSVHFLEPANHNEGLSDRPTIIILPGLIGTSKESYVLHLVNECYHMKYRCVVFNNRENGGVELKTPKTYCATYTNDLHEVVTHVSWKFPNSSVMAVGVSLGGLIVTNYTARMGHLCPLKAAIVVSAPWNIFDAAKSLEMPLNAFLFNRVLTNHLISTVMRYEKLFAGKIDFDHLRKSHTISDFDERFTCKVFGYNEKVEYYKEACIDNKISDIKIPLLALNSIDDPFAPGHCMMKEISTKTLFITGKKYFLVMMENKVEKFMKFSEVLLNGQKSKIIMDMTTTEEFYEKLVDMCHFISSDEIKNLDSRPKGSGGQGGEGGDPRSTLKSDSIFHSERRYYFDLQQNFRGVFLKMCGMPWNPS